MVSKPASMVSRTAALFAGLPTVLIAVVLSVLPAVSPAGAQDSWNHNVNPDRNNAVTLFLCGDVMTGRGIDQILPHPGDPLLHEPYMKDARGYVSIAERLNGEIPQPVDFTYIWGQALEALGRAAPELRIINLETSVTTSDEFQSDKQIHYRMHPLNVGCLTAAGIDCCVLANNHILDWGRPGLLETLDTLSRAGLRTAGAGSDSSEAASPAVLEAAGGGRVLVFAWGSPSSGVPNRWAGGEGAPGVNLLPGFSEPYLQNAARTVNEARRAGDLVVASIHWGSNWGYEVPQALRNFARGLIDTAGVDVVHGHSSHHPRPVEVYGGKLILYGCGDFINDYEGIGGYERFRDDLVLMYLVSLKSDSGDLLALRLVPFQIRHFRLTRPSSADLRWLKDTLNRIYAPFGTGVTEAEDQTLLLRWD